MEKSKDLEQEIFTFMSPEPYTYNFDKPKIQIREIKKVKKSLNKLKKQVKKKWNIYHFLTTILLFFMIIIFIIISLIIKDILSLIEDYSEDFINFIRNLLKYDRK